MESINFDLKKSLADLAQFNQAVADSADNFSLNFTIQLAAVSNAFQTTANLITSSFDTAFSQVDTSSSASAVNFESTFASTLASVDGSFGATFNGMDALSNSSATLMSGTFRNSIAEITTGLQTLQAIGVPAFASLAETAVTAAAGISSVFAVSALDIGGAWISLQGIGTEQFNLFSNNAVFSFMSAKDSIFAGVDALTTKFAEATSLFTASIIFAQESFQNSLQSMTNDTVLFFNQISTLPVIGAALGLVAPLADINQQLLILNGSTEDVKGTWDNLFDGFVIGTGLISDLTTCIVNLTKEGWLADAVIKILTMSKKLFNAEMWISIGNWIKETALTIADTVAKGAQNVAIGALTIIQKLFNAEMWISIGNWIKETALTIADTIAKGAQNVAIGALTIIQKLFNAEMWISIGNWIKETALTIADTVAKGAQNVVTGILTVAQGALNLIMSMNPIALIVIAIAALVAGFVLLWTKCEGFRDFMTAFFKVIANGFIGFVNLLIKGINMLMNIVLTPINLIIKGVNIIPGVNIPTLSVSIPTIPSFADGGFPETGQLFIAREAGPELVGNFGGRAGVMNNNQIVDSVSRGVYEAISSQNTILRQILKAVLEKDMRISLDGKEITKVVERVQKERGVNLLGDSVSHVY